MKKYIALIMVLVLVIATFASCSSESTKNTENDKLKIVTTIFPEYDWVKNLLGDRAQNAEVTMLLDNGVDLHSYQPTAEDIMKIAKCDIFIYVGGESDKWVDDALKEATNENMIQLNLMEILEDSLKEEEMVEGMQAEEEEHDGEEEEGPEYDEHVWLSLKNAKIIINSISKALETADSDYSADYKNRRDAYIEKLDKLDKDFEKAVTAGDKDTLLFGDRFPFRYLTDDYGLKYYAAFVGCSAETEASFETVKFLSKKLDELSLNAVLTLEGSDGRIAETIIKNTEKKNQKILKLDSMQSTTAKDVKDGADYISIMEKNLEVIKEALR
ncbi:MAG: metal ABC transporter substrate-binding protein [Clostridiales bacterium]|nr:metal ABC transporter substrate-binding protein [Clostridiales bacterium]